jgi:hypothetical protein
MTEPLDLDRYAGHTAGPWSISSLVSQLDVVAKFASGENVIAQTCMSGACGSLREAAINAALIADAPFLLAELQQVRAERDALREAAEVVLDGVQNWSGDEEDGVGSLEVAAAALHALRAALEVPRG